MVCVCLGVGVCLGVCLYGVSVCVFVLCVCVSVCVFASECSYMCVHIHVCVHILRTLLVFVFCLLTGNLVFHKVSMNAENMVSLCLRTRNYQRLPSPTHPSPRETGQNVAMMEVHPLAVIVPV